MYNQHIGIFGGGIAGYALAAHFEKLNIPYKIIILNDNYTNGYGITIQDADNIISYLELSPQLDKINYLNRYIKINNNEDIIFANCHSKGNYVISRPDLIELLKQKINENNIIKIKGEITLEETDNYVKLNNLIFTLLIGADGINSVIRDKMNIKKEDVIKDTQFILEIRELKNAYQLIKTDVVEFVSDVLKNFRLRLFIKPNGPYGATCQIVYPKSYSENEIKYLIPNNIYNSFGKQLYITNLKSTKYFIPTNLRTILLGDALNGMIPYHGSGANIAINNAHYLAKIIKDNLTTPEIIAKKYYDTIKDYTFRIVSESYNTFLEIHSSNCFKDNNAAIYKYNNDTMISPIPANYSKNDYPIILKNNFTEIILAGVNITEFPKELTLLENVQILNLNDNKIKYIPESIKLLSKLKELYLRNNDICVFSSEINNLTNLNILRLSYNNIKTIDINLPNLKELCLTGNQLVDIKSLQLCKKLEKLYMSENNIISLTELFDLTKIKYFRISFNPIKYNDILKLFTSTQINNIIEIRLSYEQINNNDKICENLSFIKIKYGSTLSKLNRKYFDINNFENGKINSKTNMNILKFDIHTQIANLLLGNKTDCELMNFIIKLNLLKLDFEYGTINECSNFNIIKSKINQIINLNKNNYIHILRIFTIFLTQNINEKLIDSKILFSYIKTFINSSVCDYLENNKRYIKLTDNDIHKIMSIYSVVKCLIDVNKIDENKLSIIKHTGYPIHPIEGRPKISYLECLYENCNKKFENAQKLHSHLIREIPNFCNKYHYYHEYELDNILKISNESQFTNMKCPIRFCNFIGNIGEHYKALGFKPFWSQTDNKIINNKNKNIEDYKIFESNVCMICMNEKMIPTLLYDCGHRVLCINCGYDLICKSNNKLCIICRHKTKYILIA